MMNPSTDTRKFDKDKPHKKSQSSAKRLKFVSASCNSAEATEFNKLDPSSNPDHARRIQQRRRMVMYGKNTVGYDEYLKEVPKEKRRPRSMDTPLTPDHTLDIPNKRWIGQIRAW
jgi:histone RNA hairpin-binding protein